MNPLLHPLIWLQMLLTNIERKYFSLKWDQKTKSTIIFAQEVVSLSFQSIPYTREVTHNPNMDAQTSFPVIIIYWLHKPS